MGYRRSTEVVASAARTTSGNSGPIAVDQAGDEATSLGLLVDVTATSGTPTLDVTVEWSHDGGATFAVSDAADAFAQITATGAVVKAFAVKGEHYRIVWAIAGGTPSLTFSVSDFTT